MCSSHQDCEVSCIPWDCGGGLQSKVDRGVFNPLHLHHQGTLRLLAKPSRSPQLLFVEDNIYICIPSLCSGVIWGAGTYLLDGLSSRTTSYISGPSETPLLSPWDPVQGRGEGVQNSLKWSTAPPYLYCDIGHVNI